MPARNAEATIDEQLEALARQAFDGQWELIVIDDGSTDDTVERARAWTRHLTRLRVLECDHRGVNAARNAGVLASDAPLIAHCDADDVADPQWLSAIVAELEHAPLVGGLLDVERLNEPAIAALRTDPTPGRLPVALDHLPYAPASNMGYRRVLFDSIRGFDESFRVGCDEIDFAWRAQYAGCEIRFAPAAVVYYRLRPDIRSNLVQWNTYARETTHLLKRHMDLGYLPPQRATQKLHYLRRHVRSVLAVTRMLDKSDRWRYAMRLAWITGLYAGFRKYHVLWN
jgi:glycosyltransferase involved in cell wall biosynthesis